MANLFEKKKTADVGAAGGRQESVPIMEGGTVTLGWCVCSVGDEVILRGGGADVDDALGVGVADAGKGLELVGCGGVDIELVGGSGRCGLGSGGGFGGGLLGYGADGENEKEGGGEELAAKVRHGLESPWG